MLEADTLERIAALITAQGLDEATLRELRTAWPALRFTHCCDDDICGQSPYLQAERFNLYLLDASEHCPVLTSDLAAANGVVLADVEQDER
jgi:hypothetical protein